jgi:hypothetical protein
MSTARRRRAAVHERKEDMKKRSAAARQSASGAGVAVIPALLDGLTMMKFLLVLLMALLPLQTQAQEIQLTLNCEIESAFDVKTHRADASSGGFSAIVRMSSNSQDGTVTIEATTVGCNDYAGSFDELRVSGECNRTVGTSKTHTFLRIDCISGAFEYTFLLKQPQLFGQESRQTAVQYSGHCTPGKRPF